MDEQNSSVLQEVATPEQVNQSVSEVGESPIQKGSNDPQEKNWREIRQTLKELRHENQLLRQQIQAPRESIPQEPEGEDEPYVTPQRFKRQIEDLEKRLKVKEAESSEDRVRAKYSDYDEVVTEENIEYLKQNDPELAQSIRALSEDPYKQALAAYKLLKKTDYHMGKQTRKDQEQMDMNSKKPVSVQAVRKQGVLSEANRFANGLTPELKKALLKEMQDARKGA
jgi:hypothetical protein